MEEECLWVSGAQEKLNRGTGNGLDPEKFRCKKDGKVFCWTCWQKFFGKGAKQ